MTARKPAAVALAAVLIIALAAGTASADGKLGSFKSKVSSSKIAGGGKSGGGGGGGGGGRAEELLIRLFVELLIEFFPYLVLPNYYFEYCSFPYEYDWGYLVYGSDGPFEPIEAEASRPVAFELSGSWHVDFEGVQAVKLYGKARLSCYITADADFLQYFELDEGGESTELSFFKTDCLFNVFNSPVLDLDWGLGFSYMNVGILGGANTKFTGDVFPHKPLGIHFMACANFFEGAEVYETEFSMGVFFRNLEIRLGYRAMWVRDLRIHGPLISVAIWF